MAGNSFPGVCPDWVALRWNQPTEAQQCITNYHLDILTESGSWNTSVTGTVAAVNILSSECCLRHTFTVTPVYLLTGPRDTSDPVSFIPAQSGKAVMCVSMYVPDHLHVPMVTHNHTILIKVPVVPHPEIFTVMTYSIPSSNCHRAINPTLDIGASYIEMDCLYMLLLQLSGAYQLSLYTYQCMQVFLGQELCN